MTEWVSPQRRLAMELLDRAKEAPGDPAASTLALVGIGNALLEIADQFENIVDRYQMDAIVECLGTIASNSAQRPQGIWRGPG